MSVHISAILGAVISGLIISLVAYLARDKMMRIEDKIDNLVEETDKLAKQLEEYEARNKRRHEVTLEWLFRITEASEDVEKPEEIVTDIDFSFDNPGGDGKGSVGGDVVSPNGGQKRGD